VDPLAPQEAEWERPATAALLGDRPFDITDTAPLLV
jgi:hypothetical protein